MMVIPFEGFRLAARLGLRFLCVCFVSLLTGVSSGADHFLTLGGGYGPTGNQISLEKNVQFQREVLAKIQPQAGPPELYFAAGDSNAADLQYSDPDYEQSCPRARRLMAELIGEAGGSYLRYRPHQLEDVAGPSDPKKLRRRLRELGSELNSGDRLVIYFTGHGAEAEDPNGYYYDEDEEQVPFNEHNTSLYCWDAEQLTASEFAAELDRLPQGVTVILVMVQCYSGGFAHSIFHQADQELGLSPRLRCGFFSQRHDRYAAGCTPEVREADYQEYSTFFWAALQQQTRAGAPIENADIDGDGKVSMAEAHAYAVIESDTIDIPIRTSGALLRKYSTLASGSVDDEESGNPLSSLFGMLDKSKQDDVKLKLVKPSGPLADLAKLARPDQQAILTRLAEKLELGEGPTVESLKLRLAKAEADLLTATSERSIARQAVSNLRERIADRLTEKWPELDTAYSPMVAELCGERSSEFVAEVEGMPDYEAYQTALERDEKATEAFNAASHVKAKVERLQRTCDNIVLAANLSEVAPKEIVERYQQLLELEESSLGKAPLQPKRMPPPDTEKSAGDAVEPESEQQGKVEGEDSSEQ